MLNSIRQMFLVAEEIVKIQSLSNSPTGWMVKLVNQAEKEIYRWILTRVDDANHHNQFD